MQRRLVTTWYGTFLLDEEGNALASRTFPPRAGDVMERLRLVRDGEVLDEELEIAPKDGDFEVLEQRLLALPGAVRAEPSTAGPAPPRPDTVGIPSDVLREASLALASASIKEALPPDQPVILYLRAMDLVERGASKSLEMLRAWHSFHYPELAALVDDRTFLQLLSKDPERESIVASLPDLDPGMGSGRPLAPGEGEAMRAMARQVLGSKRTGEDLRLRVEEAIQQAAPNLTAMAGPLVGARLLNLAGSLERLSRMPSSTVQLLGAERALFLHIKEGAPPPKHGVVFQHPSVHSAPPWLRGRTARALAGKIVVAARADMAGTHVDGGLGVQLRDEFLERAHSLRGDHPEPPPGWRRGRAKAQYRRPKGRKGRKGRGGKRRRTRYRPKRR